MFSDRGSNSPDEKRNKKRKEGERPSQDTWGSAWGAQDHQARRKNDEKEGRMEEGEEGGREGREGKGREGNERDGKLRLQSEKDTVLVGQLERMWVSSLRKQET